MRRSQKRSSRRRSSRKRTALRRNGVSMGIVLPVVVAGAGVAAYLIWRKMRPVDRGGVPLTPDVSEANVAELRRAEGPVPTTLEKMYNKDNPSESKPGSGSQPGSKSVSGIGSYSNVRSVTDGAGSIDGLMDAVEAAAGVGR